MFDDDIDRETVTINACSVGPDAEKELARLIGVMNGEQSALARITLLPRAKALYEELHPETRRGQGNSLARQSAKSALSFVSYVAGQLGRSKRWVELRLKAAEDLATLSEQARAASYGCPMSSQIGMLVRLARIPDPAAQLSVIDACREHYLHRAKTLLKKLELEFGIFAEEESEQEPVESETDSEQELVSDGTEPEAQGFAEVMAELGASAPGECVRAIRSLKRENARLKRELATLKPKPRRRAAPSGQPALEQ